MSKFIKELLENLPLSAISKEDRDLIKELREGKRTSAGLKPEYFCSSCSVRQPKSGSTLKLCQRCQIVHYCNKECQTKDWLIHKKFCNEIKEVLQSHEQPYKIWEYAEVNDSCAAYEKIVSKFKDFQDYTIFGYCNLGEYDKAKTVFEERWTHYHWYLHNQHLRPYDPEPVVQLKGHVDTMPVMALAQLTLKLVEIGKN